MIDHKEHYKKYKETYRKRWLRERERLNLLMKNRGRRLRLECLKFYGKNGIECKCCKEQNEVFLAIDHIEGRDKFNHKYRSGGTALYYWLVKNKFPDGFQILCFNCNWAKHKIGVCPHQKS